MAGDVESHPGPFEDLIQHDAQAMRTHVANATASALPAVPECTPLDPSRACDTAKSAYAAAAVQNLTLPGCEDAGLQLYRSLVEDDSPFALRPADQEEFKRHVLHVAKLQHLGVRPGTRKADRNSWRYHVYWCELHNTPAERTQQAFDENPQREAFREASTLLISMQIMKPRRKTDRDAKPRSGLNVVLGIRRQLGYRGIVCPPFKLTRVTLKGLEEVHMAVHGKDSLKPHRKEAMPDAVRDDMFAIPDGTRLPSFVFQRGTHVTDTVLDAISVLEDTGLRKAEIVRQREELLHTLPYLGRRCVARARSDPLLSHQRLSVAPPHADRG